MANNEGEGLEKRINGVLRGTEAEVQAALGRSQVVPGATLCQWKAAYGGVELSKALLL